MKQVNLSYGKNGLVINVPDQAVIIEPTHLDGLADEHAAILEAMRNPIGTRPLRELVKATDTVSIVIADITRPTPSHKLVPWIMQELAHVPKDNFVIINGLGSHRANTQAELIQMLGEDIVREVRVINHEAFNMDELEYVGTNSYGSKVYMNKTYLATDFKIVTGFIEPHLFAGFSGGPKGINPGIVGIETIQDFHNAELIGHPLSIWGVLDGNPVHESAKQNCLFAKPDFMLNVALNNSKEITAVWAGDVIQAHRVGCEFVKKHAMIAIDQPFDIVVTTNSGYPLDQNMYQTVKGISAANQAVKDGGAIICASECSDGLPEHGNYGSILKMRETPAELLEMINSPGFRIFDQWQVQVQAMVQKRARLYLHSLLTEEQVKDAKIIPTTDIEQTIHELLQEYGANARIAIMPVGPLTIPYVK